MFKVGTNIIGVGDAGVQAVATLAKCNFTGARFVTVGGSSVISKAEFACESKIDFLAIAEKLFMSQTDTSFVIADCAVPSDAALCCEICAVSSRMKALTVAIVHLPSSKDGSYEAAMEYVEELHEMAHSVVVINDGYIDKFDLEAARLLFAISSACNVNADKRISTYEELKEVFTQKSNIYFASVKTNIQTDSHKYKAGCLALCLENQTYLDTATNLTYVITSNGEVDKNILAQYINCVDKKNISYLSVKKLCVSQKDERLGKGEFMFSVLVSQ